MQDYLPTDVRQAATSDEAEYDDTDFALRTTNRAERYLRDRLAGTRFEDDARSATPPGSTLERLVLPFSSFCGTAAARLLEV